MENKMFVLCVLFISLFILVSFSLFCIDATKNLGMSIVGAGTIVSTSGVLVAVVTIWTYRKEAKVQRAYEFMERYVDDELKLAERYLKSQFNDDRQMTAFDFSRGLASSQGVKINIHDPRTGAIEEYDLNFVIQKVSNFYSNLGFLVAYDMIDADIIYANLGTNLLILWRLLSPIISAHDDVRRQIREPLLSEHHRGWKNIPYQAGFAYLVWRFKREAPSTAASFLMLRHMYN